MARFLYIPLLFLSVRLFAQINNPPVTDNTFLFTFKENSYVITDDSIYRQVNTKTWIGHAHNLIIKKFVFFQNDKKGYLMHNSGGIIYEFDGNKFTRIDDSIEFNSQYQSFPFLYKNSIYNFGGYGLFTFKNIITYFNESKKETELLNVTTPIAQHPPGRKQMLAQVDGNKLFMGSGIGYNIYIPKPDEKIEVLRDYWVFDLVAKEWQQLGDGKTLTKDEYEYYSLIYDFDGKNLVIKTDEVFADDIKNNKRIFFKNANIDILKSMKKSLEKDYITYNSHRKGFYLIVDKPSTKNKILFVSVAELLGKPTGSETLYATDNHSNVYIGLIIISIFIGVFLILKKKSNFKKVYSKRNEIEIILTEEESEIFKLILEKHPHFISFPDLMDVFEPHLNYDSKKKKLRQSLYQIEDKIKGVLKTTKSIFEERKNKEDQRIKEIRIQS